MSNQDTENPTYCQLSAAQLRKHLLGDPLEARLFLAGNPLSRKPVRTSLLVPGSQSSTDFAEGRIENEGSFGFDSFTEEPFFSSENDLENDLKNSPYFLIHGHNSSTPHKQGLDGCFDDVNPDFSFNAFYDRISRYADAHTRAFQMANFIKERFQFPDQVFSKKQIETEKAIASDLVNCGSYLVFHWFHTVDQIKLAAMCSCKRHLLCPLCAIRRAAKAVKVYLEKNNILCDANPHLVPYLVTFTVKDGEDLQERFDHLQKSLRKYYDHRRKYLNSKSKTRHLPNEACKALGGVGSFEIKIGSGSGQWHPHAHYVWLCESPPDVAEIQKEWHEITQDSFIVDVTPFHDRKNVSDGFLEVFKYALKYSSMSLEHNWEAYNALQGRRLVSSFGLFHGLDVPEQLTDEITFDDLPYVELVYRFYFGAYKLVTSIDQQGNERSE